VNPQSVPRPAKESIFTRKLFDLPRLSAANEAPKTGLFRSHIIRFLWGFWSRKLAMGGRFFFLASALFLLYGLGSLEMQAFIPMAYSTAVWILALFAYVIQRPRVKLGARHAGRIAAGSELCVEVDVERIQYAGGGCIVLPHRLPLEIEAVPHEGVAIPALNVGETATCKFALRPNRRGIYRLRGYRVESDYPFGLLNASSVFQIEDQLTVYPRFEPLDRLQLPLGRRYQPGGVAFAAPRGESLEYIGNRDYREGDSVRDIDWRATARLSRPIVREYREEYFLRAAVVLDTHLERPTPAAKEDLERAISLCAACGDYMNRTDYLVDILAAGPNLYHLLAGRGVASLDQMLDILACVEPSSEPPWTKLEPHLWANLEQITSVICLFLNWNEERRAFAARIASSGSAVKVVIVRNSPPDLDPMGSWGGEVPILGTKEFEAGVRHL